MAARKKHIRTSYGDKRKEHRAAASRHVLVLEAQINENDKRRDFCLQHWNFVQKLFPQNAPLRRAEGHGRVRKLAMVAKVIR